MTLPLSFVWVLAASMSSLPSGSTGRVNASASSLQPGFAAEGAADGNRFSAEEGHAWKGKEGEASWWWQAELPAPQEVGAVLQVLGDHAFVLRNAPRSYFWQGSADGVQWNEISETRAESETRIFRLLRFKEPRRVRFLRLQISEAAGEFPTLREVEFYPTTGAKIDFPPWCVAVNTTHDPRLPNHGQEFIPLAKSCPGWEKLEAQQVWLGTFDESFLAEEPLPLCAFLSGNFKDWCEVDRLSWRGVEEVLRQKNLPLWASCGGAQGLAILSEAGVAKPWDCPHCRDPEHPKLPIYTHLGHSAKKPCGDYSACTFERGPHAVEQVARDPVFQGLPREFQAMESHCGQIEWPPAGWQLIATAGRGTQTKTQCLRLMDRYVYAAQFHIEMEGTPEVSRKIMGRFLELSRAWGGYNPRGKGPDAPEKWGR